MLGSRPEEAIADHRPGKDRAHPYRRPKHFHPLYFGKWPLQPLLRVADRLQRPHRWEQMSADLRIKRTERTGTYHLPGHEIQHHALPHVLERREPGTQGTHDWSGRTVDMTVQIRFQHHALLTLDERIGVEVPSHRCPPKRSATLGTATPPAEDVAALSERPQPPLRHQMMLLGRTTAHPRPSTTHHRPHHALKDHPPTRALSRRLRPRGLQLAAGGTAGTRAGSGEPRQPRSITSRPGPVQRTITTWWRLGTSPSSASPNPSEPTTSRRPEPRPSTSPPRRIPPRGIRVIGLRRADLGLLRDVEGHG